MSPGSSSLSHIQSCWQDVLYDKLMGYWVGQLVGNFMGLPFEFTYWDEPMPIEPQT